MTVWKQERPAWCPHVDCLFRRRVMDECCGGQLPVPIEHDGTPNTYRFCLNFLEPPIPSVFDLQVNGNDLDWFRWVFDKLDGRTTSWISEHSKKGG